MLDKREIVRQNETRPRAVVLARGLRVLVVLTRWPALRPLPYLRAADCRIAVCLGRERDSSNPDSGPPLATLGWAPAERPELKPSAVAFASGLDEVTGPPGPRKPPCWTESLFLFLPLFASVPHPGHSPAVDLLHPQVPGRHQNERRIDPTYSGRDGGICICRL